MDYPERPVMVVDDEAQVLIAFSTELRLGGITNVVTCEDPRKVLTMLRRSLIVAAAAIVVASHPAAADITVYTAGPANLINALAKGFTAKSGVKVNAFQATTGKVMARIESEASNPTVDIMISASWDTATDFAKRKWTAPYQSPNAKTVPDFLKTDGAVAQGAGRIGQETRSWAHVVFGRCAAGQARWPHDHRADARGVGGSSGP